jgi:hypothetical protein
MRRRSIAPGGIERLRTQASLGQWPPRDRCRGACRAHQSGKRSVALALAEGVTAAQRTQLDGSLKTTLRDVVNCSATSSKSVPRGERDDR